MTMDSRKLYGFPRCLISAAAEELMAMMTDCVAAAANESADAARQYLAVARQVMSMA